MWEETDFKKINVIEGLNRQLFQSWYAIAESYHPVEQDVAVEVSIYYYY